MAESIALQPLGWVRNGMNEIVDDVFGGTVSRIELDPSRFEQEALDGLSEFSHVEIVFHLHGIKSSAIQTGSRHPRGREDWPRVGIFAQRTKNRPNQIGVTVCRLIGTQGRTLEVEDLDAIDGTPILDIKPYLEEFGPRGNVRQPAWTRELMSGYWTKAAE